LLLLTQVWVDPNLHPPDIRTVLRIHPGHSGVDKHTAVSRCLPFKSNPQGEILVTFFCGQVSVFVCGAAANNSPVVNNPALISIRFPAGEIFTVEEANPIASS